MYRLKLRGSNVYINVVIARGAMQIEFVNESAAMEYDNLRLLIAVNALRNLRIQFEIEELRTRSAA